MTHPTGPPETCTYELDGQFRIVSVDASWTRFALENDAPELVPPAPLGRTIWSYISDSTTAHMFQQPFDKVLWSEQPLVIPIRCDSRVLRRFLDLHIAPCAATPGLRIDSIATRMETRPAEPLLDRLRPASEEMVKMCSWCKRVEAHDRWVEVEELTRGLRLFERETLPTITHGMCPDCHARINALLD